MMAFLIKLFLTMFAAAASSANGFEFAIGVQPSYFNYVESLKPPSRSTETSAYTAGLARVAFRWGRGSFIEARYMQSSSNVLSRYDGTSLDGATSIVTVNTLSFRRYDARLAIGLTERWAVFVGYGHKMWNRFLSSGTGYREIYDNDFSDIGARIGVYEGSSATCAIEASHRPASRGRIRIITSETFLGGVDSEMDLGNLPGYLIALPVRWGKGRYFFSATPWFEYSQFGASQVVPNATLSPEAGSGIYEPASDTRELGIDLLAGVSF